MAEYLRLLRSSYAETHAQTAVHRYTHVETERQITVVGTRRFGEPAYWTRLRAVIDDAETAGAAVHCEGAPLVSHEEENLTDTERQVLAELRRIDELEKQRMTDLGLVHHIDGLGYPPQWTVNDLSYLQITRLLGTTAMRDRVHRRARALQWPDDDRRAQRRLRLRIAVETRLTTNDSFITQPGHDWADAVLLAERTATALAGINDTGRDTILVWDVSHMPGIAAGLREQRFIRIGEPQWHTFATVPSITPVIWQIVTGRSWPPPQDRGQ